MNIKSILLPVDFSHSSDAALRFASSLAADSDAHLTIVHVGEDSAAYLAGYGGFAYTPDLSEKIAQENRVALENIKPTVAGLSYGHRYLNGNPAEEILAFAEQENVDMIVIGSHGRTGLSRLLLGSIAEAVVRGSKCPVLTVKQPSALSTEGEDVEVPVHTEHPKPATKHSLH
ncbi:MAG: universal stress protein [Bythopirellula sp.]